MSEETPRGAPERSSTHLSDKAVDLAHDFLSALFMGVRTAQIHDATNAAFINVAHRVQESGAALFAAVGSFELKVVEESFFINGSRLRFHGKTLKSMRSLRRILESQQMGGFRMGATPTYDAVRKLISLFATAARANPEAARQDLAAFDIGVFGVQRLADDEGPVKVDRRVFAVHSYAKLILGLREHAAIIAHQHSHGPTEHLRPRIRVVRVIQDLAELCDDRLDLLLKLGTNAHGAAQDELTAANTCVLSLALGHALELHRRDLGDIGMAALFSTLGRRVLPSAEAQDSARNAGALARLLSESGVGQGLYTRAMVLSEQTFRLKASEGMRRAHPFSRLVRVAAAYSKLVTGLDLPQGAGLSPLDAARAMRADRSGWLDPRLVDLLINLLRAFPKGTPVTLQGGLPALVAEPNPVALDRPRVRVAGNPPRLLDLDPSGPSPERISYTQMFLGTAPARGGVVTSTGRSSAAHDGFEPIPATGAPRRTPSAPGGAGTPLPSLTDLARASSSSHPTPRPAAVAPSVVETRNPLEGPEEDPWVGASHTGISATGPAGPLTPSGPRSSATAAPLATPAPSLEAAAPSPAASAPPLPAAALPDEPLPFPPGAPLGLADDLLMPDAPAAAPRAEQSNLPPSELTLPPDDDGDYGDDEEIHILDPVLEGEDGKAKRDPSTSVPTSAYSDSAPNRLIGTYLAGKYRILRQIGEGGMGAVYLANQEPIDRKVAVKVLLSSLAGDDVAVRRFEQEAKAISRMRHPNTVTIYDFGKTAAHELYIVMEFLDGETLAELLRNQGAIPPDRAARIVRQACASLSEAHQAGIVHRDLKPDNIFLTHLGGEKDWVKVLDFGLAKLADNEHTSQLTQRGKVFGTPRYMSPEQAQGHALDARSDLYTLGVVLYELLTGRSLFDAPTMIALLVKHISEPPALMSAVRPDLHFDPNLERVVLKALAKRPDERYESCDAFAAALAPFAYPGTPSRLPKPSLEQPPPRLPPAQPARAGAAPGEEKQEELDDLLSDFLADLTPLEHIAEGVQNPFESYDPEDDDPQ